MARFAVGIIAALCLIVTAQDPVQFVARDAQAATLLPGGDPLVLTFAADPASTGGDIFHAIVSQPGTDVVLIVPDGSEINAANAEAQGYSFNVFQIESASNYLPGPAAIPGYHTFIELPPGAVPGNYQIKVRPAALAVRATVRGTYNSSSLVRVALLPGRPWVRVGEPIAFTAIVFEESKPLAGAKAMIRIRPADNVRAPMAAEMELPDSSELDPVSGNGHYMGLWMADKPGRYAVALKVTGTSLNGQSYSRLASAEFTVVAPLARIDSMADSAVDDNGDGMPDRVVIAANLTVAAAGNYELVFNLRAGEQVLTSRTTYKVEKGAQRIDAPLAYASLASLGSDGPYRIADVFLTFLDDPERPTAEQIADAGGTGVYAVASLPSAKPITAGAGALAFGDVQSGTEKSMDVVLTNSGPYPFTEMVAAFSHSAYSLRAPALPFTVPANGTLALSVRFLPTAAGSQAGTLLVAGQTINLSGNGVAAANNPVPVLASISPNTGVAGAAALTLSVSGGSFVNGSVVRWNGVARVTNFVSATNLTAAIPAADLASAGSAQVTVLNPAPGGGASAAVAFTVTSNAPTPVPVIDVSPTALAFGDVASGQTKDLPLVVRNTGTAPLSIQSIVSSLPAYSIPGLAVPQTVASGASVSLNIRFSPTGAGAQSGTLTINSNAPARPAMTVALSGNGIAGSTVRTLTLTVDDGTWETGLGQPAGANVIGFLNRLTPPSYPAKLTKILVYFGNASDELPVGHPITVLWATNPSGGSNVNGLTYQRFDTTIVSVGGFISLTLATPVTITAGDFVVGFTTRNPVGKYPMAADTTPPLRQRSYISADGINYSIADSLGTDLASNFAIRAVVEVP